VLQTALTDRLSLKAPIIGAPMAFVSGGELTAAVSAGGGLGMIGVGSSTPSAFIRDEAAKAHRTGRPFGIGLMAWALAGRPEQFDTAVECGPALVSVSFGDYQPWVERLERLGIPSATQVGDTGEARIAADAGVDFVVARGSEAGGHGRDRVATLPLLQAVLDAVDVPVLAAGGIATGRGLAAVLAAGAAGAWVGTAFLACPEALNSAAARARALAASDIDTVSTTVFDVAQGIAWPTGFPGRALVNEFWRRWSGHEDELAASPEASEQLAAARQSGDYDLAYVYAGQGVGMLQHEQSATTIVTEMAAGAERHLARWTVS
jgi:nitronate monooxygenase